MASDNAVIVIAQADGGHAEMAPAGAEHTTETTGAQNMEHAESGMPQLDPAIFPNLIFWLVVALLALYWVLSRVALPQIGGIIGQRNDAIAGDIAQAAALKRQAEEAEAAYNADLAQARDEAHRMAAATRAETDRKLAGMMAEADKEIGAKTAESEARIGEIRASAATSIGEVARDTAAAIVERLLPDVADRGATDAAVADRLKG